MSANAVLGVTIDYKSIGGLKGTSMIVTVAGNAVLYEGHNSNFKV